jgi:threonine dehydratase
VSQNLRAQDYHPAGAEPAIGIERIKSAHRIVLRNAVRTPALPAPKISALTGAEIYLKYENLQATGSFKERGAIVKLASLSEEERRAGVVAASAGNHAQAVAYHARRLGISTTIVMPLRTSTVKVASTESLGASVVLSGETLSESLDRAIEISRENGLVFVHPYDDPDIIAGQGTVALEVLADIPDVEVVAIPVGGGGLIAGNAVAFKALKPDVSVLGVSSSAYPSMRAAIAGTLGDCGGNTLADGIAVKAPGKIGLPIIRALVSDLMLVDDFMIERAICMLLGLQKTVAEGAGAAALAALLAKPEAFRGRKVCLYLSGGNIEARVLASVVLRGLGREGKIVSLRVVIPDQPGVLGSISTLLGAASVNILEVAHRRLLLDVPAKNATLDLMIEAKDARQAKVAIAALESAGYSVKRLDAGGSEQIALV